MLEVADLVTAYGKIEALKGVSLQVENGRITCLLGPNGAGKTTLMMSIAGILQTATRIDPARRAMNSSDYRRQRSSARALPWCRKTGSSFRK